MIVAPVAGPIVTIHSNGQADLAADPAELSAVSSSSPLLIHTDPSLTDKPEYLAQLLKDKRQLSALPNLFIHVERLLDQEINKVRLNLFNASPQSKLSLPEPAGDKKIFQEKVFIPVQQYPEFNFVGRILGPRGMTSKQLEAETDCKIMIRGRGSMRDKQKEELNRGKPNWEHLEEDLHVLIQCEDFENRAALKLSRAREEIAKLLIPSTDGEDHIKKKQLTELAIINGTYRDPNLFSKRGAFVGNQMSVGAPLIVTSRAHQNYFPEPIASTLAPNLFTATHAPPTLANISPGSFLPSNDPNFFHVFTSMPAFDPMSGGFLTNGAQLIEYPNQAAYPVLAAPTAVATRPPNSSTTRNTPSTASATISARYQPYSIQSPNVKRS